MEADDVEMAPEADTDIGENSAAAAGASAKRLAIKNTIHTNFGEDYVFQIASNPEISTLAVSLSTNTIKLYSPATGQFLGECRGHRGTIHEISFAVLSSPNLLCSCSSDATVRMWDTRNFKQVSLVKAGSCQEVFSFCIGGSSSNLLAGGCNSQIIFWDWRNSKQVACLEESHMADVTQVRFTPSQQNKLISSSVDGLLCLFDTDGHIDDDNHLECVMNVGTSIGKFGFFGEMNHKLWCLTHIETLSIWNWRDGRREINFEDARTLASDKWNLDNVSRRFSPRVSCCFRKPCVASGKLPRGSEVPRGLGKAFRIDYFVDCYYSETEEKLWVLGGTGTGTLGYFPVNCNAPGMINFPEAILDGGHTGVVRTVLPIPMHHGIFPRSKGIFGWSGGEDGRLCCWLSDDNLAANRSWINSNLVMKSTKASKSRHQPY